MICSYFKIAQKTARKYRQYTKSPVVVIIIIIIMVILKCYFSGEHIALSSKEKQQRCEHKIRKNQQIKSTVHGASQHMKITNNVSTNQDKASK